MLAHGAPVALRDKNWDSPPLGWCAYASRSESGPHADFAEVARLLLAAGAIPPAPAELPGWASAAVLAAIAAHPR